MMPLSEDTAASTRPAGVARELTQRGPDSQPRRRGGLLRLARRSLLRALRPYTSYQRTVDGKLLDAIDDLDRRLREQERMQLEVLTEELMGALQKLSARLAEAEAAVTASRALPYSAPGALEQFRDPSAGVVLGYRDGGGESQAPYLDFEQVFRGPEERVRERQQVFLDLVEPHQPVLDAGCGRGEFLDLMRERGISYLGVDADEAMAEHCRAKGHENVQVADVNHYLEHDLEAELGAVFSAQLVEHLDYQELLGFLRLSLARLRPGGILVAETVNPHAPHALKTFWVDPTHRHPLFPEVLLVLCRLAGFTSAYVFHPLGSGHVEDDRFREGEYALVAAKQ